MSHAKFQVEATMWGMPQHSETFDSLEAAQAAMTALTCAWDAARIVELAPRPAQPCACYRCMVMARDKAPMTNTVTLPVRRGRKLV